MTANVSKSLAEVLERAMNSRIADVWTSMSGVVEKFYDDNTADIKLVASRPIEDANEQQLFESVEILPRVPIAYQRAGTRHYITMKLYPGDGVLVHFNMFDTQNWRATGNVGDPSFIDTHLLQSCWASPITAPKSQKLDAANEDALCIVSDDEVRLGDYQAASVDKVLLESFVTALKGAVTAAVVGFQDGGTLFKSNLALEIDKLTEEHSSPNVKAKKP